MQVSKKYKHYCVNCGKATEQRYDGPICFGFDDIHCKIFPKFRNAYCMTCSVCKTTRTYGVG